MVKFASYSKLVKRVAILVFTIPVLFFITVTTIVYFMQDRLVQVIFPERFVYMRILHLIWITQN